jgi:protease PrsW
MSDVRRVAGSRGAAATIWVCLALLAGLAAWRLYGTPALVFGAALLPVAGYAALLLWWAGASRRPPLPLLLLTLLWGAGAAALLAAGANDTAQEWLGALQDSERARALAPRLAAPAIEEIIKALALLGAFALHPYAGAHRAARRLPGVIDGILYGAFIGLGFTLTENANYFLLAAVQGGEAGLWQSIYLRGVLGGLTHAAFTGTVGAALGWAAQQQARGVRLAALFGIGLAIAIAEHGLWNAIAAGAIDALVCNPAAIGGACRPPAPAASLFVIAPLLVSICLGPPLAGLVIAAHMADPERE